MSPICPKPPSIGVTALRYHAEKHTKGAENRGAVYNVPNHGGWNDEY
jgi:hypothetical protein